MDDTRIDVPVLHALTYCCGQLLIQFVHSQSPDYLKTNKLRFYF